MELRFDLEAKSKEAERLRRRTKELQLVAARKNSSGGAEGGGGVGKDVVGRLAGGGFKRERCVEFFYWLGGDGVLIVQSKLRT